MKATRVRRLSTSTLGCPQWDLATIIRRLPEYGFDGVDFRGLRTHLKLWETPEFSSGLRDTSARLRDAGLAVSCISSGVTLAHSDQGKIAEADEELARSAEICGATDCRQIRVFGGDLNLFAKGATESDRERATCHVVERCRTLAGRAHSIAGVDLLIETHDAWTNSEHMVKVLKLADCDNVGCCWDVKHTWWLGKEVAETTWSRIRPWVRNTHWKDARRSRDTGHSNEQMAKTHGMLVPLGEGIMPAADALDLLSADGYDGWFTLEWEKRWHPHIAEPEEAFPGFVRFMRGASDRSNQRH
jgi:sugar phosphate isomerase/epimerase